MCPACLKSRFVKWSRIGILRTSASPLPPAACQKQSHGKQRAILSIVLCGAQVLLLQYISQNAERHSGGGSRRARSTTLSLASSRQKDPFTITGSPNPSPNSTGNLSITETGSLLLPPMSDVSGAALGSGLSSIAPTAGSPAISTLLRGGGDRAGVGAGGATRGGLLEAKIVARALGCLEGLCRSPECKVFMGPLAREVR